MTLFQILTIIGIVATTVLGLFNLFISLKNRRNSLREHVFKEQLTFLLELRQELAKLEVSLEGLNKPWADNKLVAQNVIACLNKLDELELSKNILLPDNLYLSTTKFITTAFKFANKVIQNPSLITKEEEKSFMNEILALEEEFREHIGLDKLTEENRRVTDRRF
jgi:hypothetical protein